MAAGGAQDPKEFALFDVGTQCVAVPSHYVVQAIAYPRQISRLPRSKQALAGVFVHRGQVLPLLDLRQWMDAGPPAGHVQQVLILKADEYHVAIAIDALKGLLRVSASDVQKIHHDQDAQEFFHSVVRAEDGLSLISLLDPLRLAHQAQVWAADGLSGASGGSVSQGSAAVATQSQTATCAVVRLDGISLALPAYAVGEVLSGVTLQRMSGLGSHFLGMAQWRGQDVPLLDLARVLDLPPATQRPAPWLVVLSLEGRAMAFYVQEICAVRAFDAASVQQGAAVSEALRGFSSGSSLMPAGERVYLLDARALLDASPLSNQKNTGVALGATSATPRLGLQSRSNDDALVVFKSRQLWAASMGQMREIVALPAAVHSSLVHDGVLPASMEWRDQPVPLYDLRKTLQEQDSSISELARVIIVQKGGRTVGLLVESVDALIPGHNSTRMRFVAQGQLVEMVTVGGGGSSGPQTSYQLMDLGQLPVFA